jgi:hypothetical protein
MAQTNATHVYSESVDCQFSASEEEKHVKEFENEALRFRENLEGNNMLVSYGKSTRFRLFARHDIRCGEIVGGYGGVIGPCGNAS